MIDDCICPICKKWVTVDQRYMIGHEMKDGITGSRVIHTVTHFDCLIKPSQGSGSASTEVAASTSRSKETGNG